MAGVISGTSRWVLGVAVGGVVVLAVAAVLLVTQEDGEDGSGPISSSGPLPPETLSGPGTTLPDGLEVADGSSLIGPAVVDEVDGSGVPLSWFAVLVVEGDPLAVWRSYAAQLAELFPQEGIDAAQTPGCLEHGLQEIHPGDPVCQLEADTVEGPQQRETSVAMISVPGDVTGHYLLVLSGSRSSELPDDLDEDGSPPWPGDELPAPSEPRPRPQAGEPLAPRTTAYDGDNEHYVLLEGSELLAQYSDGWLTGGFEVLLRTTPGADLDAVGQAYAEQAVQFEGEPIPPPEVTEHAGTIVTRYSPPGGAGGYSGTIWAVDQPTGDDYIFYALIND